MSTIAQWVVFSLDTGRYALPLASVERVIRAAHVTALPLAPPIVLGVIDIEGSILPVFNLRRRFRLTERALSPDDQLLIAKSAGRRVALVVDAAHGIIEQVAATAVDAAAIASNLEHIEGIIPLEDGLVLIQDLERFLSAEETSALDRALQEGTQHAR